MRVKQLFPALLLMATIARPVFAQDLKPLDPDRDPDRIDWSQLQEKLGPLPKISKQPVRIGGVEKTMINEYWRQLADGYKIPDKALEGDLKVTVDVQAAQDEHDQLGQLAIAESMVTKGYHALLASPITDANLQPGIESAEAANIPVIDVDDAVVPQAKHFVGNVQNDNGVRAARWFIKNHPDGGKVAVVEGIAGSYAAANRTAGFVKTITTESNKFKVAASVPGNWDRQLSYDVASNTLQRIPDLVGFYCNNDGMALGVVEAVKAAGKLKQVAVIGTDGISDAYKSIQAGELTATVDSFPVLTGQVAREVALRLVAGQKVPRVIATPQALVTKENYERYKADPEKAKLALIEDAKTEVAK
ncbi:MAG TPA: substrate-binding domain-containing protein [Chthoniobacterales bacterium]